MFLKLLLSTLLLCSIRAFNTPFYPNYMQSYSNSYPSTSLSSFGSLGSAGSFASPASFGTSYGSYATGGSLGSVGTTCFPTSFSNSVFKTDFSPTIT